MKSPYYHVPVKSWASVTHKLLEEHPLTGAEIVEVVLLCWESIFESRISSRGFRIGHDIFPKPQIMGFLLHELIPLELAFRHPQSWRREETAAEKDLVCIVNDRFSIELKTSSNPLHIYGNRSYAQKSSQSKKSKSGYYLAINFEKLYRKKPKPKIRLIRFGWLDASDWIGQKAATGQQARLPPEVEQNKLVKLYQSEL